MALWVSLDLRTRVLADPTSFEEPLLDTTVTVVIDDTGGLTSVMQLGLGLLGAGEASGQDVLAGCVDTAKQCWEKSRRRVYG